MVIEDYLKDRVDDQIPWYSKKCAVNKTYNLCVNGLIIVFPALNPYFACFLCQAKWLNYPIVASKVLTAVATGFSSLLKFREKRTTYGPTAESLRHENCYLSRPQALLGRVGLF
jgi:hypothetical protein